MKSVSTSYWYVELDGMNFNGAAVKTISLILRRLLTEPTMDVKPMAAC